MFDWREVFINIQVMQDGYLFCVTQITTVIFAAQGPSNKIKAQEALLEVIVSALAMLRGKI